MLTGVDKAIQDFVISLIAIFGYFGFDLTQWQPIAIALAGAFGKAFITWYVPNKPPS